MDNLQIFKNNQFGEVRVAMTENNEPLFCLVDVCNALGISNHRNVNNRLNPKGVHSIDTLTKGGLQSMVYIDEGNLYKTTLQSRKPEAEAFQDWLCYEVAPSIRKNGAFLTMETVDSILTNPDFLIKLAKELKAVREEKARLSGQIELQEQQLRTIAPKVEYYDKVLSTTTDHTTTTIAKELGMSARTLNEKLKQSGVIFKQDGVWVLKAKYQDLGYSSTRTHVYMDRDMVTKSSILTVWTEKGRKFIHEHMAKLAERRTV